MLVTGSTAALVPDLAGVFYESRGRQTLKNVVAVLAAGGAEPHHITTMTWYFTDKQEYVGNLRGIGQAYREIIGRHFPAMAAMQVVALVEDRAKIEIQATAVVPD